ncbi:MAG: hypothetical protein B1H04_02290 [Planctomycetales bacterium 4484_123]|nr:MAG: hypothetical protein B1H04_02290 [Planctomycetales bacterium 4484_123]
MEVTPAGRRTSPSLALGKTMRGYVSGCTVVLVAIFLVQPVGAGQWYVPIQEQVPGGFDHIQIRMAYPYQFDSPAMSAFVGPSPVGEQWAQTFLNESHVFATADGPNPGSETISFAVWVVGDRQVDRPAFHYQAYRGQTLVDTADIICWGPGELDWMVAPGTWKIRRPVPPWIPGDANRDCEVGIADVGILADNYGRTGADWGDGDFTGDGLVGIADLGVLADNYGTGPIVADQPLPEPGTLMLVAMGLAAVLRRPGR